MQSSRLIPTRMTRVCCLLKGLYVNMNTLAILYLLGFATAVDSIELTPTERASADTVEPPKGNG